MKVSFIELCNFRAFKKLRIDCNESLNVFAGINGCGKSTVLDALAITLSWLIKRIPNSSGRGMSIAELDIRNGENKCYIEIFLNTLDPETLLSFRWHIGRTTRHSADASNTQLGGASRLASRIRENADQDGLPIVAYYSSKRIVLDIPLRIRKKHAFDPFECYDEALKGASNFRHFFEWFRNREDLENENRKYKDLDSKSNDVEFPDRQLEAVRQALEGSGIVLIDEIELHLHPGWQRDVIKKLAKTFPNCQFFISTHSPQVLGEVHAEHIHLLNIDKDGTIQRFTPEQSFGLESNDILNELMQTNGSRTLSRNIEVEKKLNHIFQLIDTEKFDQAKQKIQSLKDELHSAIPDLVRAEALITMFEPLPSGSSFTRL